MKTINVADGLKYLMAAAAERRPANLLLDPKQVPIKRLLAIEQGFRDGRITNIEVIPYSWWQRLMSGQDSHILRVRLV